ncbi:MAG TPA: hypothetical protein VKB46_06060, partial [Pyrinomonadaceae bacterium]|nr:hypothetical protein [Pyrinomonadaceae bacterium]
MITTSRQLSAVILICAATVCIFPQAPLQGKITIDARKVENRISPLLYGQFIEYMFEGVKYGLHAELLRDRGFEESPNAIGLPRYWSRYPDDRVDDYALAFHWDGSVSYPPKRQFEIDTKEPRISEHSLRMDVSAGVVTRHGLFQDDIPIRRGVTYRASIWLKPENFSGSVTLALESAARPGVIYASDTIHETRADWQKYDFTLQPKETDQLARFV